MELQANNARKLWLAVQNLNELLTKSVAEETTDGVNFHLVDIKSSVEKIRSSAPDNQFIQLMAGSIPSAALEAGIWSEPDLKERFHKLHETCRRVALIDERGGSLLKYALSYVQSFFILRTSIDTSAAPLATDDSTTLAVDKLNTFSILDYAQFYIENGNFESALRLMQQLKGEPRRLAKDWINDALLLVEIKQASSLLNAYISSMYFVGVVVVVVVVVALL